jgi:hypothetical protein
MVLVVVGLVLVEQVLPMVALGSHPLLAVQ